MNMHARIDSLFQQATAAKKVPGIVAIAANDIGIIYEGAFGKRNLATGTDMTLDSVFWFASMTKAVTAVAIMQLVERGVLSLEQEAGEILPELRAPKVLEGFGPSGQPLLRPAKNPITVLHLMNHTSGHSYDIWNEKINQYKKLYALPSIISCRHDCINTPLVNDPGEKWEYGTNFEWLGKIIETVTKQSLGHYFDDNIFQPLGINDIGFTITPSQRQRLVSMHMLQKNELIPIEFELPKKPEFFLGGGGLYGTAKDFLILLQMILHNGNFNGQQILKPETVSAMFKNHIGDLVATPLITVLPEYSTNVDFFPEIDKKWGLSFLINTKESKTGRSAGSISWAGLSNTFFWIDPKKKLTGIILSQYFPFMDENIIQLYAAFEKSLIEAIS